jgi:hypothetical protein
MRNRSRFLLVITMWVVMITSACSQASPSAVAQLVETTTIQPPTALPSKTPTETSTSTPTRIPPTETITPTNTSSPTPACTNKAEFVKHLTIGDNTVLKPGEYFAKLWLVKNTGTCTWTQEYSLVFVGGSSMLGPQSIPLPKIVPPGDTVELRVDLNAPVEKNTHISNWMLQDESGNRFGVGDSGEQAIELTIVIKATPWPTPS